MKTFKVPCTWEMSAWATVKAESFDKAVSKVASTKFDSDDDQEVELHFSTQPNYIKNSFDY